MLTLYVTCIAFGQNSTVHSISNRVKFKGLIENTVPLLEGWDIYVKKEQLGTYLEDWVSVPSGGLCGK